MAHFPQSQGNVRAPRVSANFPITIKTDHGHAAGVLHHLSETGGIVRMKRRISSRAFAELIIGSGDSQINALIELLGSARHPQDQAFRIVAIDDGDHARLQSLMRPGSA